MPEEASNQSQRIDDLILDILLDEAQIIRCLRVFFCETLQALSEKYAHCPELKIRLADNLITAAAKKEEALAAVLEAISLFEGEPEEWIPLAPGASYPLPPEPDEVATITLEAKTDPGTTSQISCLLFGAPCGSSSTATEISREYELVLTGGPYPIEYVNGIINIGSNTIYFRNLKTE